MRRLMLAITVLMLSTAATAYGQQPAPPADAQRPPAQMQPGGAGMPMMEMCRTMMAGHMAGGQNSMGGGMMMGGGHDMMGGMMGGGMMGGDPRMMAHMVEMRGEIMKATGDIMVKHAQKMQQQMAPPATK